MIDVSTIDRVTRRSPAKHTLGAATAWPARLAALGAALLTACSNDTEGTAIDASAPDAAQSDAAVADAQSACEAQHLVCGTLGTGSCGTCEFAATCLPDQTGCLEVRQIVSLLGAPIPQTFDAVDLGDRILLYASDPRSNQNSVYEISDAGEVRRLDSSVQSFSHTATTARWVGFDNRVRGVSAGSFTSTLPTTATCTNFAVTPSSLLCDQFDDGSGNGGIYQFVGGTSTQIVQELNVTDLAVSGDRLYYLSGGALHGRSLSTGNVLPTSSSESNASTILGVTSDEVFLLTTGKYPARTISRMPLDGSALMPLFTDAVFDVLGVATGEVLLSERVPDQRIGRVLASTAQAERLLAQPTYTISSAAKRDGAYVFLGSLPGSPSPTLYVLRLTR